MNIFFERFFLIYIAFISVSFNIEWLYLFGSFAYADLALPLLIISLFKNQVFKFNSFQILLLFIFLLSLLSTYLSFFNYSTPSSLGYLTRSLYFLILFTLISSVQIEKERVVKAVCYGLLISLISSWLIWSTNPRYFALTNIPMLHVLESPLNLYVNRNETGLASSILALIAFYSLIYKKIFSRNVSLIIFAFAIFSSIISFSRGTWVVAILGITLIMFLRFRLVSIFFVSFFLSSLLFLIPIEGVGLIDAFLLRLESDETNFYRYQYILDAFKIGLDNFFLGIGPGNYKEYAIQNGFLKTIDPHNTYMQSFAELGIFGLIFCISIYFFAVSKSFVNINKDSINVLLFTIFSCLAVDGLISGLSLSMKILYILAGVAFSERINAEKT